MKKKLLSGIKPTGRTHIDNYFEALRQWIETGAEKFDRDVISQS